MLRYFSPREIFDVGCKYNTKMIIMQERKQLFQALNLWLCDQYGTSHNMAHPKFHLVLKYDSLSGFSRRNLIHSASLSFVLQLKQEAIESTALHTETFPFLWISSYLSIYLSFISCKWFDYENCKTYNRHHFSRRKTDC